MNGKSLFWAALAGIATLYGCGGDASRWENSNHNRCITESDCESGICLVTGVCAVFAEAGARCGENIVCRPGYRCVDSICQEVKKQTCTSAADCDSGLCLENGLCAVYVGVDEACDAVHVCKPGLICDQRVCTNVPKDPECASDIDCQPGTRCVDGLCRAGSQECNPETLPPDGDWDGDGVLNGFERAGNLDPCNADTDGDGVIDGDEDFTHNGIYEPELGETDPTDPRSVYEPGSPENILVKAACRIDDAMKTVSLFALDSFFVAGSDDLNYRGDPSGKADVLRFESDGVVGFYAGSSTVKDIRSLLAQAVEPGSLSLMGSFPREAVPSKRWQENGTFNAQWMEIPGFDLERQKYILLPNGKSLQEIADIIAGEFEDGAVSGKYESSPMHCDQAVLHIARSVYDRGSIYSVALACDANDPGNSAILEDVCSGMMTVPNTILSSKAVMEYAPGRFFCNLSDYAQETGKIDVLWVVDNSISMGKEQQNLKNALNSFANSMKDYGIEYRAAVTTTDAYLLDEDPSAYVAYDEDYNIVLNNNTYLNGLGLRQLTTTVGKKNRGFLDIVISKSGKELTVRASAEKLLEDQVASYSKCMLEGTGGNICGIGIEDGLKSGAFALSRLAVDVDSPTAPPYYSKEDRDNWDTIRKIKQGVMEGIADPAQLSLNSDKKALLYVVWVTDEESRQFKELPQMIDTSSAARKNMPSRDATGKICRSGYKLDSGSMRTGALLDDETDADAICSPELKTRMAELIRAGMLKADSSMEEIEAVYPEYAEMLKYYIRQYQNYAQDREIVGFALVGDSGRQNGEFCTELAICRDEDCTKYEESDAGRYCIECKNWDYNGAATEGANYGLSYIHMARFLSSYYPDDPAKAGKPGGYGNICSSDYALAILTIAEDIFGNSTKYPLRSVPIASTIRVHVIHGTGMPKALRRNQAVDGWFYDRVKNSIRLSGVSDLNTNDKIAISYVTWSAMK